MHLLEFDCGSLCMCIKCGLWVRDVGCENMTQHGAPHVSSVSRPGVSVAHFLCDE